MSHSRRDAARWAVKHMTDCLPEALSGRADPARQGRHQHSLRDLDAIDAENGSMADGRQAPAPLVDAPASPAYDDGPVVPRAVSAADNALRAALGLPALRRPGESAALEAPSAPPPPPPRDGAGRPQVRHVAPEWPGVRADLLTGVCVLAPRVPGDLAPADAARLAAAQQAVVTRRVDALGNVYGYSVSIDPQRVQAAAWQQWQADEGLLLGAGTSAFRVNVNDNQPPGAPATADVVAQVSYSDFLLALAGVGRQHTLTVQAVAGTCGSTAWPGSAPPWCQQ